MTEWKHASQGDKRLFQAISILLKNYPHLVRVMFDPKKPELREGSETLRRKLGSLSSGESLLIRIGMDLWNESGDVKFTDLDRLDTANLKNLMEAICYLRQDQ